MYKCKLQVCYGKLYHPLFSKTLSSHIRNHKPITSSDHSSPRWNAKKMAAIPETMTAVRMYEYGGPEVLKAETHPIPVSGDNQVLSKDKAASVPGWDYVYRNQKVKPIPGRGALPLPQQLGREASGDVALVGKNVHGFAPGDRIVTLVSPACGSCPFCQRGFDNLCIRTDLPAHTSFGGYAEYIVRDQQSILHAPDNLSYGQLACILWSYGTVLNMIGGRAQLRAREPVLITGASGGMSTAAIQLAKLMGACPIIALSSASKKYRSLQEAGADVILNYKDKDIAQKKFDLIHHPTSAWMLFWIASEAPWPSLVSKQSGWGAVLCWPQLWPGQLWNLTFSRFLSKISRLLVRGHPEGRTKKQF